MKNRMKKREWNAYDTGYFIFIALTWATAALGCWGALLLAGSSAVLCCGLAEKVRRQERINSWRR